MNKPEQPAKRSWLLHTGLLAAGGLVGAIALAGVALVVLSATPANMMIWFLIIPWVVGGWEVWTITVLVFLALGVGFAYGAFLIARALWRLFKRRVMERNDGVQV